MTEVEEVPRSSASRTVRDSLSVATGTLASRVTGMLRAVAVAAVLGPTWLANGFQATNTLPNLIYSAVAGPVLIMVLVPILVRVVTEEAPGRGRLVLGRVAGLLVAASGAVALLLVAASPVIAWALTFGIPDPAMRARAEEISVLLLVAVAPQVVLYTVAAVGAAAQQARGRFRLAAAAPAVENLGLIATLAAVWLVVPSGYDVGDAPLGMVAALGIGSTLSVAVHAGLQLFGAHRVGLSVLPRPGWRRDPDAREAVHRVRGSLGVAAGPSCVWFGILAVSATVPGGVIALTIAYAVYNVPTAIGARAVATAVLPGLSAAAHAGDTPAYGVGWRRALSFALLTTLPLLCLMTVFARPVAEVLAVGRGHDASLIAGIAVCLLVLGVSQVGGALHEVGRQALFARLDVRGPQWASGAYVAAASVVCLAVLLLLPSGTARLAGAAAVVLAGDVAAAAVVLGRIRRALGREGMVDVRSARAAVVALVAMGPVALAGAALIARTTFSGLGELVLLALAGLVAVATFAGAFLGLRPRVEAPR